MPVGIFLLQGSEMDQSVVVDDDGTVTHRVEGWFHDGVTEYDVSEAMNKWPEYAQQISAAYLQVRQEQARKSFQAWRGNFVRRFGRPI